MVSIFPRKHYLYTGIREIMQTKLERIAEISRNNKKEVFTSLYHLLNRELLMQCNEELDGKKAVGIDGVSKAQYEENLDNNIDNLVIRLKNKAFKPMPSKRKYIPKSNGSKRPLGIATVSTNCTKTQSPFGKFNHYSPVSSAERIALGTLIIKTKLGVSDDETTHQIAENPYLQYFLGYPRFKEGLPFASSLITHFRKRFNADILNEVNEKIALASRNEKDNNPPPSGGTGSQDDDDESVTCKKSGKLLLDATCAPADIQYPIDTRLLNDAREKLEEIIDILHRPEQGTRKKARIYRQKAHESYIAFTKLRKPKPVVIRKMRGKLLRYVRWDLKIIEALVQRNGLELLNRQQYKNLLVIQELYRQQLEMYEHRQYRKEDRIVSISQLHVRPIVRGKASASVEFGAKISVSVVNGFVFCDRLEWDAYHEGNTMIDSLKKYKAKNGFYPEAVLADKIYRTKDNRDFCKARGIRLSGPKLGRSTEDEKKEAKKQAYQDSRERNKVEGIFGTGKRKYTMDCIMAKLKETSESVIMLNLLVMNLEKRLRLLLYHFSKRQFIWITRMKNSGNFVLLGFEN